MGKGGRLSESQITRINGFHGLKASIGWHRRFERRGLEVEGWKTRKRENEKTRKPQRGSTDWTGRAIDIPQVYSNSGITTCENPRGDQQRLVGSAHPTGTTNYRLGFVRSVKFKMPRHGLIEVFQSFVKSLYHGRKVA